jgi:hypothetical protein
VSRPSFSSTALTAELASNHLLPAAREKIRAPGEFFDGAPLEEDARKEKGRRMESKERYTELQ